MPLNTDTVVLLLIGARHIGVPPEALGKQLRDEGTNSWGDAREMAEWLRAIAEVVEQ